MRRVLLIGCLVLAATPVMRAEPPEVKAWPHRLREAGVSRINLPVEISLRTLEREISGAIPRPIVTGSERVKVPIFVERAVVDEVLVPQVVEKVVTEMITKKVSKTERRIASLLLGGLGGLVTTEVLVQEPVQKVIKETIQVPKKISKIIREVSPVEAEVRYRVEPGTFRLAIDGSRIKATATLHMKVQTGVDAKVIAVDLLRLDPKVEVIAEGRLELVENRLAPREVSVDSIRWSNLGPLGDILRFGPIDAEIRRALTGELRRALARTDLRSSLAKTWSELNKPIPVGEGLRLYLQPEALAVTAVGGDASRLLRRCFKNSAPYNSGVS